MAKRVSAASTQSEDGKFRQYQLQLWDDKHDIVLQIGFCTTPVGLHGGGFVSPGHEAEVRELLVESGLDQLIDCVISGKAV